ncbi:MAG: serine/threonine protein kinase [Planctomycetes bacterium]|nr:serine/threonine protein kinase [Planctomycetota bacterium]
MANPQDEHKLRWQRIKQLFDEAVELDQNERGAWLVEQCGDDRDLLAKVQSLLECDEESSSFLQPPLGAGDETLHLDDGSARLGRRIGAYTLNRVIASGGMGTVYEATQEQPRRTVAVKLMRAGITSRSALRRFEYESQLLARLRHPGIAQVYDAGTHRDGDVTVPFFAMEYIGGAKSVTDYAKEKTLGTRERMALFANVCEAVHHGHQKGIIHRDLKPSNILVDSSGQVKIIDFGVARSTDSDMAITTLQTGVGQLIGTLQYMSPEQCAAAPHDIDTRSDVYALGVVFYEMLCERMPYDLKGAAIHEATRVIREQEPTRLSTLNKTLRGDVETIVLKALEKDRDRRYQSASALTADIKRYLNNEAISAHPPSAIYQLRVFARRNKGFFSAVAAVFIVLVAGVVVSTTQYFKADAARKEALAARAETQARADELKMVTEFQQSMLGDIDAEKMGRGIIDELREGIRKGLGKKETITPQEVESSLASFGRLIGAVNATNLALNVVDENVLARAVETIHKQFADQPLVRAALEQTVADTYRDIGLFERAMPLQEACLQIRRRELGDDHTDTLISISNMGLLLRVMGKYEEALSYGREALEGSRRVLGDDHPNTLNSISNMGHILKDLSKYEEALLYAREAAESRRRVLGDDHPSTLLSINNMGYMLKDMGKYAEALPYLREVLESDRRVLGDDHPSTAISIHNMGQLMRELGRLDEAEPLGAKAVRRARRTLPAGHSYTGVFLEAYGKTLLQLQRFADAEAALRESHSILEAALGAKHERTLKTMNSLIDLYESRDAAEPGKGYAGKASEWRAKLPETPNDS